MNNVSTDGTLNGRYAPVPASKAQVAKYRLLPGDVLFNSTNSPELVGKTTIFHGYREPVVFSNHCLRLRVDRGKLDPAVISRSLVHAPCGTGESSGTLYTMGEPGGSSSTDDLLANCKFPLPPLPEQQRIAAILARADRLRRLRRYALELSEGYLQAVFVEMFGDPVRNPKGWKKGQIARLCAKTIDGPHATPLFVRTHSYACVRSSDIQNGISTGAPQVRERVRVQRQS